MDFLLYGVILFEGFIIAALLAWNESWRNAMKKSDQDWLKERERGDQYYNRVYELKCEIHLLNKILDVQNGKYQRLRLLAARLIGGNEERTDKELEDEAEKEYNEEWKRIY